MISLTKNCGTVTSEILISNGAVKVETSPGKPSRQNYQHCFFADIEFETTTITEIHLLATIVYDIVRSEMGLPWNDSEKSRGLSSVMGFALVFGMVIAGSMVIVSVGAVSLSESQSVVSMESAVTAMNDVDATISSIRGHSGSQASIKLPDDGEYVNSGWIQIEITDSSGTVQNQTGKITLGKYAYERDGQEVAYQGGGVWRGDGENFVMVSPPDFEYAGGPNPTLSFPITSLEGTNAKGSSYTVSANRSNNLSAGAVPQAPVGPGHTVEMTIRSEYAGAWGAFLRENSDGDLTVIDDETVQLQLKSPKQPAAAKGAVATSPISSNFRFSNHVDIDYYDSRDGPYVSSEGNGDLPTTVIRGSYQPENHALEDSHYMIQGEAIIEKNNNPASEYKGDILVGGTGGSTVRGKVEIEGEFHTQGDLFVEGAGRTIVFHDNVYVGGDITQMKNVEVKGDIHVQGEIQNPTNKVTIQGDVQVGGSSAISKDGSSPTAPTDPNIGSITTSDNLIAQQEMALSTNNDNADESSDIQDIENGNCNPCRLESGEYLLSEIDMWGGNKLILDTSGGPIDIVVDGKTRLRDAELSVTGPNQAEIYSDGSVDIRKDSKVMTSGPLQDSTLLTWHAPSDESVTLRASKFTGLFDAPGADFTLEASGPDSLEVYGAIIGKLSSVPNHGEIHFDQALRASGGTSGTSGSSGNEIDFLRISNPTVDVREGS